MATNYAPVAHRQADSFIALRLGKGEGKHRQGTADKTNVCGSGSLAGCCWRQLIGHGLRPGRVISLASIPPPLPAVGGSKMGGRVPPRGFSGGECENICNMIFMWKSLRPLRRLTCRCPHTQDREREREDRRGDPRSTSSSSSSSTFQRLKCAPLRRIILRATLRSSALRVARARANR